MRCIDKIMERIRANKELSTSIVGVVLLKGASILIAFIMTPMYLSFFKDQGILGVWYTLQSILVWILTFDFGVGNGIRNKLGTAISNKDASEARKIISSGYMVFGALMVFITVLLACIVPFINWQKALNTSVGSNVLDKILLITLIGIALQFFFKLVTSILMALRKNVVANALPIITNLLILLFLLSPVSGDDEEKFVLLAVVYSVATILPLLVSTGCLFCGPLKHIRPSWKYWDTQMAKSVLKVGGGFFAIQLGLLVLNSTNQVLINLLFGGEAVVDYTLYYRLYSMAAMIFTLFTQPVWSEITVRYAKGDLQWIRKIYRFMIFIAEVISGGCLLVTGLLPFIFQMWLGENIVASRWIGLIFSVWSIVEVFTYAGTCIANGMTKLKCQMVFTLGAAVAKIPVTIACATLLPDWISVVIAHTIILIPLMITQNVSLSRQLRSTHQSSIPS